MDLGRQTSHPSRTLSVGPPSFSAVFSACLSQLLTRSGIDGHRKPVTQRLVWGITVKDTDFRVKQLGSHPSSATWPSVWVIFCCIPKCIAVTVGKELESGLLGSSAAGSLMRLGWRCQAEVIDLSTLKFCGFHFAPPAAFSLQGSSGSCASLPPSAWIHLPC